MLNPRSGFLVRIPMRLVKEGRLEPRGFPHIPQNLLMALSLTNMSFGKCDRKGFS